MKAFVFAVSVPLLISSFAFAQTQPQVTIGHIAIVDTPGMSEHELNQIAKEVEGKTCTTNDAADCIGERVRDQFQQRGYFKALVLKPRLKPRAIAGIVDANVVVEPGLQYLLAEIQFRFGGQPTLSKTELNPLITAHPGMIFNTREVRKTLENLRECYVSRGYPKVAIVPEPQVNDQTGKVSLILNIQPEG